MHDEIFEMFIFLNVKQQKLYTRQASMVESTYTIGKVMGFNKEARNKAVETARKLKGVLDDRTISEMTGLNIKEITELA